MTLTNQTNFKAALLAVGMTLASGALPVMAETAVLRFGHDQPVGSMYDAGHEALKKAAAKKSGGELDIQIFPAGQLGNEVAMIEGMRLGSVDGAVIHAANAATVVPELGLFSVSYLFRNGEHFNRVVSDPAFRARVEELIDSKDLGLKFLGFYSAGVRNIYTRKGPIETPGDLKGVKLRVMNNPVEAEIWSTLGAIPTPMNFGEVYQALLSGVLDAAENAPSVIESNRHFEAANTLVLTEHQRSVALLLMSKARFDALTEAQKTALIEASEIATKAERVRDAELNSEAVARMEKAGVKVVKPDTAKFAEKVNDIQNKVAADLGVKDVLAIIQSHAE